MGWDPMVKVDVVSVATPAEFAAAVPRIAEPSRKIIGAVAPAGTVAVKVTGELGAAGFEDEVRVTAIGVLATVTVTAGEVAGLLLASPGVLAVIRSVPIGREGTVRVATPFTMLTVPSGVDPL
jgi:hypothetical protein